MDDDKFKKLFQGFEPEMKSDDLFMSRLQNRLDNVELVKERNDEIVHRSRIAVVVAFVVGIVAGSLLSLAIPHISAFIHSLCTDISSTVQIAYISGHELIIAWGIIAATASILAYNSYILTFSLLKKRF